MTSMMEAASLALRALEGERSSSLLLAGGGATGALIFSPLPRIVHLYRMAVGCDA